MAWNLGLLGAASFVAPAGAYDLLQTEILTGSQASVTFSDLVTSYGSTYQHLQLRIVARSTSGGTTSDFFVNFNGDTGSNYSQHYLRGSGSAMESGFLGSSYPTGILVYQGLIGDGNTANSYAATVLDILDPFNSSKNTTTRALTGYSGSTPRITFNSGAWFDTDSLTSITLDDRVANFKQYSRFSLYGLRS